MPLPRVVLIDGKAHRWADLVKLRKSQASTEMQSVYLGGAAVLAIFMVIYPLVVRGVI